MKTSRALARVPWIPALFLILWAAPAPAIDTVLDIEGSDSEGINLTLHWSPDSFAETAEGLRLELPACRLDGESGAPMLPLFHHLIALPPGFRAELDWAIVDRVSLSGEPMPFPTAEWEDSDDSDALPGERFIRDEEAFSLAHPILAELGEPSTLRDLRVQALLVSPVGWDPASGLSLATEIRIRVRFLRDRAALVSGEPVNQPEKLWDSLYRSTLLNGDEAGSWRRRKPVKDLFSGRSRQSEALLKLQVSSSGLQGLTGEALIAAGLPAGTSLADIAVFQRRFDWDTMGQPDYREIPVARFFRDQAADGDLDAGDQLVFLGRRLKDQAGSVDPIEWYGRDGSYFLAVEPSLALEMETRPAWQSEGDWTTPSYFHRHFFEMGEVEFYNKPISSYYVGVPYEYWQENLFFFNVYNVPTLRLDIPSPGYLAGSEAQLDLRIQGYNIAGSIRTFDMIFTNSDGTVSTLPQMTSFSNYPDNYTEDIAPGILSDGVGNLLIDRVDESLMRTLVKSWDLEYRSHYVAWNDSLLFNNGGQTGDLEFRIERMTRDRSHWLLVKSSGENPQRYQLQTENQQGASGDYTLRFRDQVDEDSTWWLADESNLYEPGIEEAVSIDFLEETASYDLIVVSHEDFMGTMLDRYKPYRESQGYRVKVLSGREVWDAFFGGASGAIGLRNAARFAYQQWGTEAILLVGDSNKDARALNQFAMPNFMPAHSIHEIVDGVNEVVALDEWIAKFQYNAWPSLIMGRIPAGNQDELDVFLDKLECFESSESSENCAGDKPWRRRALMIADDSWSYSGWGDNAIYVSSERMFRIGQEEAMERIDTVVTADSIWGLPGGFASIPFFEEVITVPWYEANSPANSSEILDFLRPILWPVFVDSLSQGYLFAYIQSHANRNTLTHEGLFDTGATSNSGDQDYFENVGMPFIWAVLGCHGNSFCIENEASKSDCMGEKLIFLDENRGAVASYASDGFEFLYPNASLTKDIMEMMFWTTDTESGMEIFPQWVLGSVLAAAEIRYGSYNSSLRYNLLGDPLTRMDAGPPLIRMFQDGEEMIAGDEISVQSAHDTMQIRALITDEAYISQLHFYDSGLGSLPFEARALVDSAAAAEFGHARVWELTANVPYNFSIKSLVVEATDLSGRIGRFNLPNPKWVILLSENGDTLRQGQYVRNEDLLKVRIRVPHREIPPASFSLVVDGKPTGLISLGQGFTDDVFPDSLFYRIDYPYSWEPGEHRIEVFYEQDFLYGGSILLVDTETRLLSGFIFPNPFRNSALFRYELTGAVREGELKIYTLSGRLVRRLEMAGLEEGREHWIEWDGLDQSGEKVANGTYLTRMVVTDLEGEQLVWQDRVVRMR